MATFEGTLRPSGNITTPRRAPAAAIAIKECLWPDYKTCLKVHFINGEAWQKRYVEEVVTKHYHAVNMRIRFEFLEGMAESSDIRVKFTKNSLSLIGRDAEQCPGETMELNISCPNNSGKRLSKIQSDVLHEFGHALGLEHEHQHPGCPFHWDYPALQTKTQWNPEELRRNFEKIPSQDVTVSQYDPKSIMHYAIHQGDTMDKNMRLPQNTVLSEEDHRFLALIYPSMSSPKE